MGWHYFHHHYHTIMAPVCHWVKVSLTRVGIIVNLIRTSCVIGKFILGEKVFGQELGSDEEISQTCLPLSRWYFSEQSTKYSRICVSTVQKHSAYSSLSWPQAYSISRFLPTNSFKPVTSDTHLAKGLIIFNSWACLIIFVWFDCGLEF